ncbi:AMP-binding protein [Nonomuraea longicatena]
MTWTELVMSAAPGRGDRPAVTDVRTGEVLTYATLAKRVTHAAAGLRRYGLRYGDRVLVDLPPGAAMPTAAHAVAWAGGVVVLNRPGSDSPPRSRSIPFGIVAPQRREGPKEALGLLDLVGETEVEFGPLAGPALSAGADRVLTHEELAGDLRRLATRLLITKDDVVLVAVSDRLRALRTMDMALMSGAHMVVAHEPTLIGCRVLASEHQATLVVAPFELARRLLGNPYLRVVDERTVVSSLSL